MHRLFWLGCLLAVLAAGAVYLAADYAEGHPDSPTGCCVRGVYHVAFELNPVKVVAGSIGRQAAFFTSKLAPRKNDDHAASGRPCAREAQRVHKTPACCPPLEVIDLSMLSAPEPGGEESETPVDEARACAAEEEHACQAEEQAAITVPPTPIEDEAAADEDPVPEVMPPCKDDDEEPSEMKASTEELIQEEMEQQKEKEMAGFWLKLLGIDEDVAPEELPMPTEEAVDDSSSPEEMPMPPYHDRPEPGCEEPVDESKDASAFPIPQYTQDPATPMTEETPKADEPPMVPEGVSGEESEMKPGTPPDCREDPHHDVQYQGCPYMGGCPGMHHVPPPPIPEQRVKVKKKKTASKPETVEDPGVHQTKFEEIAEPHMSRDIKPNRHYTPAWKERGSYPEDPEVDTMEFRKSDAKKGEFDPQPW